MLSLSMNIFLLGWDIKMPKLYGLATAIGCATLLLLGEAQASTGQCTLKVDGKTYLNGTCNIEVESGGSFTVGVGDDAATASKWFAYVELDAEHPGTAVGQWNGKLPESRAHDDLGTLTRRGACWVNSRATECAVARQMADGGVLIDKQGGATLELVGVERPSSDTLLDTIKITLPDGRQNEDKMLVNCERHVIFDMVVNVEKTIDLEHGPKPGELVRYKPWAFSCPSEIR
jgi:hypothetical protein